MIQLIVQVPPPYHGAALMNKYLVEFLTRSKFSVDVILIDASKSTAEIGKFSPWKVLSALKVMCRVVKARRRTRVTYLVMSVDGFAFYRDIAVAFVSQLLGKKTILHLRGKGFKGKLGMQRTLVRYIFSRSYLIQHSQLLANDIDGYGRLKTFYIPNGWPDVYADYTGLPRNLGPVTNILFLSNLTETKGIFVTLDAVRELRLNAPDLTFKVYFIGAWPNVSTQRKFNSLLEQYNIRDVVEVLGPKYGNDKYCLLRSMDIMVFPTFFKFETWGNVNLEAMMFEMPIISTPEGAIPDIIDDGHTGFIVPQKNSKVLAEKMETLIRDPSRRISMGKAGREKFLERFTIDKFETNMTDMFEEVLQSRAQLP